MPRIRKKTSKRGTTAQRVKVKHKVAESRKKSKKAAKKDLTWKSKKSKDPGIPNNFPYKDQILAEIAEERRLAAESKTRRKEEKKNLRAQQKVGLEANGNDDGDDDSEGGDFDGVATLGGATKSSPKLTKGTAAASALASTPGASGSPLLLKPGPPHLAAVLDKADVVIEIVDARDPLAHRSHALETRVASREGQRLLLVLNKIDACPRETTAAWAAHLRSEHPTLLFRVASSFLPTVVTHDPTKGKGKSKEPLDDAWGLDAVTQLLGLWAQEKTGDGPLYVAVVGLTNSGKSGFINSIACKATLEVYAPSSSTNSPTTTPYALEVTLELDGKPVIFLDTPGLVWQPSEEVSLENRERRRAQDVLLRNKGRIDRLKDPMRPVSVIVSRAETEDLMVFYGLPAFAKGDVDAFLLSIARTHGLIKKGGNPDLAAAARLVLRDWSNGKLSRYTVPPAAVSTADAIPQALMTIYEGDAALLERLPPRKELRRTRDLVRLSFERIDDRALALEAPWFGTDVLDGGSGSDDVEDEGEGDAIGSKTYEDGTGDEAGLDESAESNGPEGSVSEDDNDDRDADAGEEEDKDTNEDEVPPNARTGRKRRRPSTSPSSKLQSSDRARPSKKKVVFAASASSSEKRVSSVTRDKKQKINTLLSRAPSKATPTRKMVSTHVPAKAPPRARKPAANAPAPTQKRKQVGDEDGAYDFSRFF